ncbi:MAG TPA: DNA primase catalytic subunit PriS [Thermoplasmata archaeon]|jgi:DNA primase small subunit
MAEADPAKEATGEFLRRHFRRHYETTRRSLPDRFGRREFGFMFFNAAMVIRHLGFSRESDLNDFFVRRVPAHAYYSSAYYDRPGAPTMEEKGWLGADLVFDLDADHLPNANKMTYPEMLEAIRLRIVKLYDEFLGQDFGFEDRSMRLVFSGGRGYHIHVFDERVWSLGSHERREIVDWITAKGYDFRSAFKETAFDAKEFRGRTRVKKRVVSPPSSAPGWRGKIARGLVTLAKTMEPMEPDEAIRFLSSFDGVSENEATNLYSNLFKSRGRPPHEVRGVDLLLAGGPIEVLTDRNRDALIDVVVQLQQIRLDERGGVPLEGIVQRGDTDEPVTSDIKRLIRLPSSLHGKTGLQVMLLTRDEVDDFRPLRDAVPPTWTEEAIPMRLANRINLEIRDESFNLEPGVSKVPQYLAIFLAARGLATVAPEA